MFEYLNCFKFLKFETAYVFLEPIVNYSFDIYEKWINF